MQIYDRAQVAKLIKEQNIGPRTNVIEKVNEYYNEVVKEIIAAYKDKRVIGNQIHLSLRPLMHKLGRYKSKAGKDQYWLYWFEENAPLYKIVKKGYNVRGVSKEMSMIETTIPLEILVAGNNTEETVRSIYENYDVDNTPCDDVEIDIQSLEAMIRHARYYLENENPNLPKAQTIKRNIVDALLIKAVVEKLGVLPQLQNPSEFGRMYYQGLNLQNVHKTVRHAALGDCTSFDISSAVFAWKHKEAAQILNSEGMPQEEIDKMLSYTAEYIELKSQMRNKYAQLVWENTYPQSINRIKQVFTAISFGADATKTCWWYDENNQRQVTAIHDIIRSEDKIKTLINDPWFSKFLAEQKMINGLIVEYRRNRVSRETHPFLYNKRDHLVKNKLIAYLYQQEEKQLMDILSEVAQLNGAKVLLRVHDAFYARNVSAECERDLKQVIAAYWPKSRLDKEQIKAFNFASNETLEDEKTHFQIISQQEQKANGSDYVFKKAKLILPRNTINKDWFDGTVDPESAYQNPVTADTPYEQVAHLMEESVWLDLKKEAIIDNRPTYIKELLNAY